MAKKQMSKSPSKRPRTPRKRTTRTSESIGSHLSSDQRKRLSDILGACLKVSEPEIPIGTIIETVDDILGVYVLSLPSKSSKPENETPGNELQGLKRAFSKVFKALDVVIHLPPPVAEIFECRDHGYEEFRLEVRKFQSKVQDFQAALEEAKLEAKMISDFNLFVLRIKDLLTEALGKKVVSHYNPMDEVCTGTLFQCIRVVIPVTFWTDAGLEKAIRKAVESEKAFRARLMPAP